MDHLRKKARAAAVSAAAIIVVLQVILPTVFDIVTGLALVALVAVLAGTA